MPRVPMLPQVEQRPIGTPQANANPQGAFGDTVGRGLQQLGAGVQSLGGDLAALEHQERSRANEVKLTEADTELERHITQDFYDDKVGFFHTQGEAAYAAEQPTWERLQKRISDIEQKTLATPEQRQAFRQRATKRLVGLEREKESYLARQTDLIADTRAKARQDEGVKALSQPGVYGNDEARREQMRNVEAAIRATKSPSKEVADAEVAEFKDRAAQVMIHSALRNGEFDVAERLFFAYGDTMSPERKKGIDEALKDGRETRDINRTAGEVVKAAKQGDWISPEKVNQALAAMPEGKQKDRVSALVIPDVNRSEAVRNKAITARIAALDGIYLDSRRLDDPRMIEARAWLRDPDNGGQTALLEWEDRMKRRISLDTAKRTGDRGAETALRQEQDRRNKVAENLFMSRPPEERASLDIATEFREAGLDELGTTNLQRLQQSAKELVQKGEAKNETSFVAEGLSRLRPTAKQSKDFTAELRVAFFDFVRENKRRPNSEETSQIISDLGMKFIHKRTLLPDREETVIQHRAHLRKEGKLPSVESELARGEDAQIAGPPPKSLDEPVVKVLVTDGTRRFNMPADAVDAWLKTHPTFKKGQ